MSGTRLDAQALKYVSWETTLLARTCELVPQLVQLRLEPTRAYRHMENPSNTRGIQLSAAANHCAMHLRILVVGMGPCDVRCLLLATSALGTRFYSLLHM